MKVPVSPLKKPVRKKPAAPSPPELTEEEVQSILAKGTETRLSIDRILPNDWNPNSMSEEKREKLWYGMEMVIRYSGKMAQQIVVRPHPSKLGFYEIIDGEQKWRELGKHRDHETVQKHMTVSGEVVADVNVLEGIPEFLARTLTSALNWLRGDPDPDKYPTYLKGVLVDQRVPLGQAERLLPESRSELDRYIDFGKINIEKIEIPTDAQNAGAEGTGATEHWMRLTFDVSREQAEVVERVLSKIGAQLGGGKNIRGRSLEMMAALADQIPVTAPAEEDDGGLEPEEE